ncbi:MAG: hypothetical protein D6717_03140, partial [Gammaproteobacteria bacterium]
MEFRLPQILQPNKDSFPSAPRQVKRWIKELPLVNMGETARRFYDGLKQLNRLDIPPKQRLEDMELMRETAHVILDHLGKHFVGRAMPLPPKSRKIAQFNQVLLVELAHGYKHILHDVANRQAKLDNKRLSLAIERALFYLDRSQVLAAQTYTSLPPQLWLEANQLYGFAERNGLSGRSIKEPYFDILKKCNAERLYIKMCLFAISRPEALHLGDARKLDGYLEYGCTLASLLTAPRLDTHESVFVVNIDSADPPQYRHLERLDSSEANRYLDVQKLREELQRQIDSQDTGTFTVVTEKASISFDLARRVLENWDSNAKRRFARAAREDTITTAIGLQQIWQAIEEDVRDSGDANSSEAELTLQTIPEEEQVKDWWNEPVVDLSDTIHGQPANVWDMVASGTVINDEYIKEKKQELEQLENPPRPESWQEWKIVNASAGGYCLRWEEEGSSRAQVGELIGLREREGRDYEWRIGIIRWMSHNRYGHLEIGVQLLAPKTLTVEIDPPRALRREDLKPIPGLMLPGIRTIQQKPTIIVPGGRFRTGDDLSFTLFNRKMHIVLTQKLRSTPNFAQFQYRKAQGA